MKALTDGDLRVLEALCARHRVKRLELFGSAANVERYEPDSDLDFLVEFEELTPREHADAYFGLIKDLEGVFRRPVDLVERRAIRNPYFLRSISNTSLLLYVAS